MGLQRVGHDLVTEEQQTMHWEIKKIDGTFLLRYFITVIWNWTHIIFKVCLYWYNALYIEFIYMKSKVAQSCMALFYHVDCSLPGSSVHGNFQARVLECVVISFSRGSSRPKDQTQVSYTAGRRFTLGVMGETPSCVCVCVCVCVPLLIYLCEYMYVFYSFQSSMISERKINDQWENDFFLQL